MATVLVVEPDPQSARTYAETLQRAGFRVESITSENEPQELPPDLVVISVPKLERSLPRVVAHGRSVPRIVLSSDAGDAARAPEFDCAAVLIRPVMYDDLVTQVRRILKATARSQPV